MLILLAQAAIAACLRGPKVRHIVPQPAGLGGERARIRGPSHDTILPPPDGSGLQRSNSCPFHSPAYKGCAASRRLRSS
jgi:hypothetical protein